MSLLACCLVWTGITDSPSNPQRVHLLSGKGVVMMAAGLEHSLALTASGDLYAFGDNLRYVPSS